MKRMEFEQLAQRVLEGLGTAEEVGRLEVELQRDGELRRVYRETFLMDEMLEQAAVEGDAVPLQPVVPVEALLRRQRRKAVSVAVAAAAALVLAVGLGLHFIWLDPAPMLSTQAAPNTIWDVRSAEGKSAEAGDLKAGDEIRVQAGTVELEFSSGVRGIVQGPARMVVDGADRLSLSYGTGRFQVPKGAEGFKVRSRRLDVVDLGTDFGMVIPEKATLAPEVHVFQGRVRASAVGGVAETREFVGGDAARVGVTGRFEMIEPDRGRFFTELPDDLPYLRLGFEPVEGGRFGVMGNHPAVSEIHASGEGKVITTDGIRGRAVRFGKPGSRITTDWKGTLGDAPRTMAAWIRLPQGKPHRRYQTLAGWGDPTIGFAGKCELLVIRPGRRSGSFARLSFDQFLFTGTTDLADGRWHHVAAVYDGGRGSGEVKDRVRLYVDGVKEPLHPRLTEVTSLPKEPQTREGGFPLVIGDLPVRDEVRTFQGEIDEVVIFEAALDEDRIRQLARKR